MTYTQNVEQAIFDDDDEWDDLDGSIRSKRNMEATAPVGQQEDDASDYYPSDLEETKDCATPASHNRRQHRALTTIRVMANHYLTTMPIPSSNLFVQTPLHLLTPINPSFYSAATAHLFQMPGSVPPHWMARLRRYNEEEGRWVEKGPIVIMIVPCRNESPWEARIVCHFTYGTQSVAVNMPISDLHHLFIRTSGTRTILSSMGQNIIAKAFVTQYPRKLRDLMAPLSQQDDNRLRMVEADIKKGASSSEVGKSTSMATPALAAEKLSREMMQSDVSGGRVLRSGNVVGGGVRDSHNGNGMDSNESSGPTSPERPGASGGFSQFGFGSGGCGSGAGGSGMHEFGAGGSNGSGNSEYLYECRTTVVGVKEEESSLFMFIFENDHDAASFHHRFAQAATDYGRYCLARRLQTFMAPQIVQRVLLTGQIVQLPGGQTHLSPYAANEPLARQMAENGLVYTPVIRSGEADILHRVVCTFCRSTMAIMTSFSEPPSLESIRLGHQSHPLATRLPTHEEYEVGDGICVSLHACRCFFAFGIGELLVDVGSVQGGVGAGGGSKGKKAAWDVVVVN
ncbi:hypothetical protein HDU76_006647 [Blyttiomyces sp. JEL0837]|nr:hypothetical protein HDU76_006647 [Blyttiomyces sp. JEL0837]